MKQLKLPFIYLIVICMSISIQIIESKAQQENDDSVSIFKLRAKRQASRGQVAPKQQFLSNQNGQSGSMAASMAVSSSSGSGGKNTNLRPDDEPMDKNEQGISPGGNIARPDETYDAQERPLANQRPKKPLRKPVNRQRYNNEADNEEDCYDDNGQDYDDYGGSFFQMATRPMRQFGRIMDDMMNRMPMQNMNYDGMLRGASVASSASAMNDGDGFSRLSSSVTNNGKTRGIVSETRNGRTQTRRIERDNDEDTGDQPSAYSDDDE